MFFLAAERRKKKTRMDSRVNKLDQKSSSRWWGYVVLIFIYLAVGYGISTVAPVGRVFSRDGGQQQQQGQQGQQPGGDARYGGGGKYVLPSFAPPNVAFAIVWPILYILAGYSVCRVVQRVAFVRRGQQQHGDGGGGSATRPEDWPVWIALLMAVMHLALSNYWIFVFSDERFRDACYVLLGLIFTVALQTYATAVVDKVAGFVLIPMLVWLGYALLMNTALATTQQQQQLKNNNE